MAGYYRVKLVFLASQLDHIIANKDVEVLQSNKNSGCAVN